jgi:guanine deaminase
MKAKKTARMRKSAAPATSRRSTTAPATPQRATAPASAKTRRAKPAPEFMAEAARLSLLGMRAGSGGPFGAVIVRDGKVVAGGHNEVLAANDPTAHAEVVAIRAACRALATFDLQGCELYTSCEPCPMCLSAAYWARIDRIVFANSRRDAAAAGFGDDFIYRELAKPGARRALRLHRLRDAEAAAAFAEWIGKPDKTLYGPRV